MTHKAGFKENSGDSDVGNFFRYVGDFLNVLNRPPTYWIGHQHLKLVTNTFGLQYLSPTSMEPKTHFLQNQINTFEIPLKSSAGYLVLKIR